MSDLNYLSSYGYLLLKFMAGLAGLDWPGGIGWDELAGLKFEEKTTKKIGKKRRRAKRVEKFFDRFLILLRKYCDIVVQNRNTSYCDIAAVFQKSTQP